MTDFFTNLDYGLLQGYVLVGNRNIDANDAALHVIPTNVFQGSAFLQAANRRGLWNNNDFTRNGVPLPWQIDGI